MSPLRNSQSLFSFLLLATITAAAPFENITISRSAFVDATSTASAVWPAPTGPWLGPKYKWHFRNPLPIPPVKQPKFSYTKASTGATVDFYEVEVKAAQKQIFPDRPATNLFTYDGISPGPTFQMHKGREAVVRFTNNSPTNSSVHVHGQFNRAPFDGWAADYAYPGQYKDYYYPNAQNARTIWYHDHTEFETGENVYMGLDGFYLLHDKEEESLNLPTGDYDVPLLISAKQYGEDGQLVYNLNGFSGEWGDILHVNGQPWPYFKVEPRKYRLRLLNGAVSRTFDISINEDTARNSTIPFDIIASDAGLFSAPVPSSNLAFAMGERYEIIIDFAAYANQNVTMYNRRGQPGMYDYAATDRIMRFVVGNTATDTTNNGDVPQTLHYIPPPPQTSISKNFNFSRKPEDGTWVINGVGWADVENRILTRPTLGEDEIWELHHNGENASHPVHIHLVDFQILSRTGGRGVVLPYERAGMKDVVWMAPGETIRVVARYAPWNGVYMFHCHNLVHEDHDMLVAFNVTNLAKWGYDNSTRFIDPMAPEFRPNDITAAAYTDAAIAAKLDWFLGLDAYNQTEH